MNLLITDQGKQIEDKDGILREVAPFYTKLFWSVGKIEATQLACTELLQYTSMIVTLEQRESIEVVPTSKEIRLTMKRMPKEKSPGMDAMISKVLSTCWSFVSSDYINMIQYFWSIGELSHNFRTRVMKVIPKNPDKMYLRD